MSSHREQRGWPRLLWSLRTKLLGLSLLLVVVPGLAFALIAFSSARAVIERAVGHELSAVAHDAGHALTTAVADVRHHVHMWTQSELMRDLAVDDVDKRVARYLQSITATDPAWIELVCVDLAGRVVAASEPGRIGQVFADREWFPAASRGGESVVGPRRSPRHGRSVLELAAPIPDPDDSRRRLGVLMLVYDWEATAAVLAQLRGRVAELGSNLHLLVLDEQGVLVGGSFGRQFSPLVGRSLRDEGWTTAAGPAAAAVGFAEEPRAAALVAREGIDEVRRGWSVLAVWPLRDALAPVARVQRQWSVALVALLAGGLAVAAALAGRIVRPLHELTDATRELARVGGATRPVAVRSRDEIGELAAAFNAMARELQTARDDLVAAAKFSFAGEVAAGIAHEVRTPLGVLRTSAQILGRSLSGARAEQRELVEMIVAEVDRIERVVAGLTELARPREPAMEPTALGVLLSRAVEFVTPGADEKGIALELDVDEPGGVARCDPEQIYQVILNLVVNATQVVPRGGHVRLRLLPRANGSVGFEVADDGPGMTAEVRSRLFTPFFTTREEGTGLGLALVDRIVRAHHGTIEVESEPGRGARFRVRLPAATEEPR